MPSSPHTCRAVPSRSGTAASWPSSTALSFFSSPRAASAFGEWINDPGSNSPISSCLPLTDRFERVNQHQNIECEIVANPPRQYEFDRDRRQDHDPDRQARRQNEPANHGQNVGYGIDDAVAVVVEGDGRFAIAIDD